MRTVIALARCAHFGPTVAVTTFATLLAATAGKGLGALLVGAAVLTGQLSVGWSNDWIDRDRDHRAGRTDKPIVAGDIAAATVIRGAFVAASLSVALSVLAAGAAGLLHVFAVASAWSYNLGLKRSVLSPLPYVISFGLLPAFVTLARPDPVAPPAWLVAAAAALGAAAHLTNVLPDLETDAATGVRGLPHRLGARASLVGAAVLLGAALVFAGVGPARRPSLLGLAIVAAGLALVVAVVIAGAAGRGRLAFRLTIGAAGAAVAAVLVTGL